MFELRELFWNIGTFAPPIFFAQSPSLNSLFPLGLPLQYYPLQIFAEKGLGLLKKGSDCVGVHPTCITLAEE